MNQQITVLVPTSPIPSHPSTAMIEETIDSVIERLPDAQILLMVDGIREEQKDRTSDYKEYKKRISHLAVDKWANHVAITSFSTFSHQATMTRLTLNVVNTPLVMFVEHDAPLIGEIDFDALARAALTDKVNVIRLHHEASVLDPHRHLMLDNVPQIIEGVPLLRTVQWSQRPHIAKTEFYRWLTGKYFGRNAKTMIEDVVYSAVETNFRERGVRGWFDFKLWMYSPPGDIKRSTHLDGRGDDPKYGMTWAYDGDTPLGAPNPRNSDDDDEG